MMAARTVIEPAGVAQRLDSRDAHPIGAHRLVKESGSVGLSQPIRRGGGAARLHHHKRTVWRWRELHRKLQAMTDKPHPQTDFKCTGKFTLASI
jgi:hypothetical protein